MHLFVLFSHVLIVNISLFTQLLTGLDVNMQYITNISQIIYVNQTIGLKLLCAFQGTSSIPVTASTIFNYILKLSSLFLA